MMNFDQKHLNNIFGYRGPVIEYTLGDKQKGLYQIKMSENEYAKLYIYDKEIRIQRLSKLLGISIEDLRNAILSVEHAEVFFDFSENENVNMRLIDLWIYFRLESKIEEIILDGELDIKNLSFIHIYNKYFRPPNLPRNEKEFIRHEDLIQTTAALFDMNFIRIFEQKQDSTKLRQTLRLPDHHLLKMMSYITISTRIVAAFFGLILREYKNLMEGEFEKYLNQNTTPTKSQIEGYSTLVMFFEPFHKFTTHLQQRKTYEEMLMYLKKEFKKVKILKSELAKIHDYIDHQDQYKK